MAECLPVKERVIGSNPIWGAMENIDYFDISRKGNNVVLTFYDIVEDGEEFVFPLEDAWRIMRALKTILTDA
jgi:hypothetical protein